MGVEAVGSRFFQQRLLVRHALLAIGSRWGPFCGPVSHQQVHLLRRAVLQRQNIL